MGRNQVPDIRLGRIGDRSESGCTRVLVDRLWPRGVRREAALWDYWYPKVAPSTELRRWLHAHRTQYPAFCQRYLAELDDAEPGAGLIELAAFASRRPLLLLTAARQWQESHLPVIRQAILALMPDQTTIPADLTDTTLT